MDWHESINRDGESQLCKTILIVEGDQEIREMRRQLIEGKKGDVKVEPIPVVVVSEWEDETEVPFEALKFIKKPFETETLMELIHKYCGILVKVTPTKTTKEESNVRVFSLPYFNQ